MMRQEVNVKLIRLEEEIDGKLSGLERVVVDTR